MQIEGLTPLPLRQAAQEAPSKAGEEARMKQACQEFEQLFLTQMLAQMRSSVPKSDVFGGGGSQEEMFQGMLDQERAKAWAQEGGIGLANLLFQQMKETL
ncbi:MAG: rod-binding protein [Candidatus Eremiobacterota bacterium]